MAIPEVTLDTPYASAPEAEPVGERSTGSKRGRTAPRRARKTSAPDQPVDAEPVAVQTPAPRVKPGPRIESRPGAEPDPWNGPIPGFLQVSALSDAA